jgi:hypothetical protein
VRELVPIPSQQIRIDSRRRPPIAQRAVCLDGDGSRKPRHYVEARRVSEERVALADQVLERRSGFRLALPAQQLLSGVLVSVARDELDPQAALRPAFRQEQVSLAPLKLDNITSLNNTSVAEGQLADTLRAAGRLRESVPYLSKQLDYARPAAAGAPRLSSTTPEPWAASHSGSLPWATLRARGQHSRALRR